MEENERYIYTKIDGYYWIKDTETNENYCFNKSIVKLLNQQDARIKELEKENQKANIKNYLTDYYLVEKENQQLKEQLSNEEQSHDLCIKSFEEETEKLRKQIKFESDSRERFKRKNQQLKQAQKQLAIVELVKLRKQFFDMFLLTTFDVLRPIIDEQIKKLMGEID